MTAFGDMTPCDFTPLTFGNARDESIVDIWNKMISHEEYCAHRSSCRMQNPDFRKRWVNNIPESGPFPYPFSAIDFQDLLDDYDTQEEQEVMENRSSIGIKG
jgi:MoaA/NifB/PqqE/SkfB family radical SAM enzyme